MCRPFIVTFLLFKKLDNFTIHLPKSNCQSSIEDTNNFKKVKNQMAFLSLTFNKVTKQKTHVSNLAMKFNVKINYKHKKKKQVTKDAYF